MKALFKPFFLILIFSFQLSLFSEDPPKEVWRYHAGGDVNGMAYDQESRRVFCGSDDNHLYCLSDSGSLIWKFKTGNYVFGVAYDQESRRVFCGSYDNHLYCLGDSGQVEWKHAIPTGLNLQLALDGARGIAFYPSGSSLCAISYRPSEEQILLDRLEQKQEKLKKENTHLQKDLAGLQKGLVDLGKTNILPIDSSLFQKIDTHNALTALYPPTYQNGQIATF